MVSLIVVTSVRKSGLKQCKSCGSSTMVGVQSNVRSGAVVVRLDMFLSHTLVNLPRLLALMVSLDLLRCMPSNVTVE